MSAEVMRQIQVIADELNTLRTEFLGMKSEHQGLHSTSVQKFVQIDQALSEVKEGVSKSGGRGSDDKKRPLMKPEQVSVPIFAGAITDGRAKYLDWAEKAKDRVDLFDDAMLAAVEATENQKKPITEAESLELGI